MSDDLPTINVPLTALPSTILNVLGLPIPEGLTPPIPMKTPAVNRIVFVMIDNFGLFEIVAHKPQFVIEQSKALIMLETNNPYTDSVLTQIVHAGFEPSKFNLFEYLHQNQKSTLMIGKKEDVVKYAGNTQFVASQGDMTTWINGSKYLNRIDFLWLHFLDFEELYKKSIMFKQQPPENLVQKLIHRTDKWMLGMYKQSAASTLLIISGDHGRTHVEMYDENSKYGQWRKASLPIAVLCIK
ncbi:MAG: hypothetical protein EAX96_11955 [Candidatus Lokiarchaeota archaeon]|nr:hypothetical protein [Candidatus Lokiarchaeota archaeon]